MFGRLAVQPLLLLCLIKWFLRWRSYSEFQWRQDLFHRCRARNRQSYVCPIIAMCFKSYCYHYFHDTSGISCIYILVLYILSSKWFASRWVTTENLRFCDTKQLKYLRLRNLKWIHFKQLLLSSQWSINCYCSYLYVHIYSCRNRYTGTNTSSWS